MTCVVGIATEGGGVVLAADREVGRGWTRRRLSADDAKVFRKADVLLGACGYLRELVIVRHRLEVPAHHPADKPDAEWVAVDLADAVRQVLEDAGALRKRDEVETAENTWLVGYRGRLYEMGGGFEVSRSADAYDAIGSGAEVALGSLWTSERVGPIAAALVSTGAAEGRARLAVEAAGAFAYGVDGAVVDVVSWEPPAITPGR